MLRTVLIVVSTLPVIAPAAPQDGNVHADATLVDANNDGRVDAAERRYDPAARRDSHGNNFRSIDSDRDGFLAPAEAANDVYVDANFENWDVNDDGVLDDGEVDNDWAEWDMDSFHSVDIDGDGAIDADEAAESGYVDHNLERWDLDRDGTLSEEEVTTGRLNETDDGFETSN